MPSPRRRSPIGLGRIRIHGTIHRRIHGLTGPNGSRVRYAGRAPMDRQTTFLLALGMLIAAALVVSVSGWVLFLRDRALAKALPPHASDEQHGVVEES
jgi:hypothetical protein